MNRAYREVILTLYLPVICTPNRTKGGIGRGDLEPLTKVQQVTWENSLLSPNDHPHETSKNCKYFDMLYGRSVSLKILITAQHSKMKTLYENLKIFRNCVCTVCSAHDEIGTEIQVETNIELVAFLCDN